MSENKSRFEEEKEKELKKLQGKFKRDKVIFKQLRKLEYALKSLATYIKPHEEYDEENNKMVGDTSNEIDENKVSEALELRDKMWGNIKTLPISLVGTGLVGVSSYSIFSMLPFINYKGIRI